jgi:hypothetical protein
MKRLIVAILLFASLLVPFAARGAGFLMSTTLSAASTNSTNIKASSGRVHGWTIVNTNATLHWVLFYDKATAPTCNSDTIVFRIPVVSNNPSYSSYDAGLQFSNGIGICIATSYDGTGNATANAVSVNLAYF